MSSIQAAVAAIVQGIADILPSGIDCRQLANPLDADELARGTFRAPAVHVCLLGASLSGTVGGSPVASLSLCAYVISDAASPDKRLVTALPVVDLLLRLISGERWGSDDYRRAKEIAARLTYSTELDRRAVTVWEISWSQELTLREASLLDPEELHLLRTVSVAFTAIDPTPAAPEAPTCEACAALNPGGDADGGDA